MTAEYASAYMRELRKCPECARQNLTDEEIAYGHDCEA
jgi:hypothetical protein